MQDNQFTNVGKMQKRYIDAERTSALIQSRLDGLEFMKNKDKAEGYEMAICAILRIIEHSSATDICVGGKWISVEDRLPNTDVRVLVALISKNGNKGIDDCFYSFKKNKFLLYSTLEEIPEIIIVTHWQPLPEPPTE